MTDEIKEEPTLRTGRVYKIIHQTDTNWCYVGSTFKKLNLRWAGHKYHFKCWLKDPEKVKKCSWFIHAKDHDISEYRYVLLQEYEVENQKQLHRYEGEWIIKLKGYCCNETIAGRTRKEHHLENKEKIQQQTKAYREANKEYLDRKKREYQEANKEKSKASREAKKQERLEKLKAYIEARNQEQLEKIKIRAEMKKERKRKYREANKERANELSKKWKEANPEKAKKVQATYREKHKERINEKFECECGGQYTRKHKKTHEYSKRHQDYLNRQ